MSNKKVKKEEDALFESIPPKETFDAFPSLDIFPASDIAFLTGKTATPGSKPESDGDAYSSSSETAGKRSTAPAQPRPDAKPVSKPVKISSRASVDHTVNQTIRQAKKRPVQEPVSESEKKPVSRPESEAAPHSEGQKTAPSTTQSVTQTNTLSATQSLDQPQNFSTDLSHSQTQDFSRSQSFNYSLSRICVGDRLNENQRKVLSYLLAVKPYIIKFRTIGQSLDLCEASVRTILRRLSALDFLSFKKARDGAIQGISIAFNQNLCEQFLQDQTSSHTQNISQNQPQNHSLNHFDQPSLSHSPDHKANQSFSQPESRTMSQPNDLKIDRKENLSILEPKELDWSDDFMALMWPNVFEAGFRSEQIRQVVDARRNVGKEAERELLVLSLDRADWELEEKGRLTNLQNGEKVRNPAGYIFTALARWGVLRAHPEYVSREEQEAQNALAEIRRKKEAAGRVEEALFMSWLEDLSPEERRSILAQSPGGPEERWLKNYWRKNIKQ